MAITNLGRVGFVPRGDWSAGEYKRLDSVRHNKIAWWCQALTTVEEPGTGTDWMLVVVDGADAIMSISWNLITTHTQIDLQTWYLADTTGGSITLTLPTLPAQGQGVYVNAGRNASVAPVVIGRNGMTINGLAQDAVLSTKNELYFLIYDGNTWQMTLPPEPPAMPKPFDDLDTLAQIQATALSL